MSHDGLHADITERIVGCAIEVHRHLGAGLLQSVYEASLGVELALKKLPFERQVRLPLHYKGQRISEHRVDLIVDNAVVVEVKAVQRLEPIHIAQVLTYLRVSGIRVGLILNFNSVVLRHGIRRVVL
jgi:GxxExxY protein